MISEMFMTQDKSQDFESTWKFVNQRLQNAEQLKRASMTVSNMLYHIQVEWPIMTIVLDMREGDPFQDPCSYQNF